MNSLKLLIAIGMIVITSNFTCVSECSDVVNLQNWSAKWVNNSGREPQIATDGPIPKNAFGIRLQAEAIKTAAGSIEASDVCYAALSQPFASIRLISLDSFDTIPAQTDISDRFMLRYNTKTNLEYVTLNEAVNTLSFFWELTDDAFQFDLLMVEPPTQPGDYRFSVQLKFDTTSVVVNRDTLFALPTITLQ